jgi:methylthioxylose transferase
MNGGRRADLVALGVEVALVAAAFTVGGVLNARGVRLWADAAPIFGQWQPHAGWGTPAAVAVAAVVVWRGPSLVRHLSWPRLLATGYAAAVAWILSLALVDGWRDGLANRLTPEAEYLNEVPRVTDIPAMLAGFADKIVQTDAGVWSTHTAGHPPGALLIFVWLDRIGLGGGGPAALTCVLAGATITVSVPVALRWLGDEAAARAALPFLVLFPGAVWVGASADGIFAAVVAAGLMLLAAPRWQVTLAGGLALGFALYLSYGFVLVGVLALAVVALRRRHRLAALSAATAGAAGVAAVFTAAGFWWPTGYELVVERYYQGWAADRPYGYWVWANLAALVLAAGPLLLPALRRTLLAVRHDRVPSVVLPLAAAVAVLAADLSGLSKAEVERIWLPFTVWLVVAAARLPPADRRAWLIAQAVAALAVNHLLWTWW